MRKKYYTDYHLHTDNSFDSTARMEDYCRRAIEIGLAEIAFTEHYDLNPVDNGAAHFSAEKYFTELASCRRKFGEKLVIRAALELGEPYLYREQHFKLLAERNFDFLIGSVHYLGDQDIGYLRAEFSERDLYAEYLHEVLKVAREGEFDVLGHLDVLKRYAPENYRNFNPKRYEELIREILSSVINRGLGIEINTSGYRQGFDSPFPDPLIIRWFKELGGEIVTIGSDSHRIEDLGKGIVDGIQLMQDCGIKYLSTFSSRRLIMYKI